MLNFDDVYGRHDNAVVYASTTVEANRGGNAYLAIGSDDGVRVWVNGARVHNHLVGRAVRKDEDVVPVQLQPGANRIMVKIEQGTGEWGLAMRVMDDAAVAASEYAKRRRKQIEQFQWCELVPENRWDYVFAPGEFPRIVWDRPGAVEAAVGSIPLKVRWFNAELDEVARAEKPGRYMAYVTGTGKDGTIIRRQLTFFCRPHDWYA